MAEKVILTFLAQQYGLTAQDVADRYEIPLKDVVVEGAPQKEFGRKPGKRKTKLIEI